jgi:hypothetical protein
MLKKKCLGVVKIGGCSVLKDFFDVKFAGGKKSGGWKQLR